MSAVSDLKRKGNTTIAKPILIDSDDPLEVDLYVCETCREMGVQTVGKLPSGRGSKYHAACTGPVGHDHKQAFMKPRRFREVVEDV